MKFARYLQDAQTPEWKNAYIDYRGLKAQLRVIRAKALQPIQTSRSSAQTVVDHFARNDHNEAYVERKNTSPVHVIGTPLSGSDPTANNFTDLDGHELPSDSKHRTSHHEILSPVTDSESPTPLLHTILSNLPAIHSKFFDMLDAELAKVETFYSEREKEMHEHAKLLRKQLHELNIHRQMFHESAAHLKTQSWAKRAYISVSPAISPLKRRSNPMMTTRELHQKERGGRHGFVDTSHMGVEHRRLTVDRPGKWRKDEAAKGTILDYSPEVLDDFVRMRLRRSDTFPSRSVVAPRHPFDPQEYQHAKRRLRKAVSEHYRGLEALNNYRVLNLAGFRKALRKYGKITKIPVLDVYMKEKLDPSTFASGALVGTMLKEMEHILTMRFERGDRKKAVDRLRVGPSLKTYHSSTLRSGLWLGFAVPAVIEGCFLSFQEHTRSSLPSWNILLYIYSILVIPVLLAVLIGVNIVAWARNRINYVFIFELNPRSRLDYHEYFELPSFLLCTLAYSFWLSLAQIGPPMLWPLIWLLLALVVMMNPIRSFMWGRSRWWAVKKIAKLWAAGWWEVEFTDVWLGDLVCSLVYSISNLYFLGCFYVRFSLSSPHSTTHSSNHSLYASFPVNVTSPRESESSTPTHAFQRFLASAYDPRAQEAWSTCGVPRNWVWYCLLGIFPFLVRFVQCLRRYRDTKLSAQLLNAGKYGMGMVYYVFYFYWRSQMNGGNRSYVLWCFMATLNSMYGYAWDILMDWRLCRPHAQYPLLRSQLIYSSHIPWYYFALLSDLCIRFIWLTYIFLNNENWDRGVFISALLEMLRRVQWSFFRLENKHLSNMDLYRATREVPLPYDIDAQDEEARERSRLRKRLARLS